MSAIHTSMLTRLYRNGRGIREVNLEVSQGEVFGFLGLNGAGKTTLIRTILGFLTPQKGSIRVFGTDAVARSREVRRRVGYLPSDPALYDFMTGRQNIEFSLALRGVRDRSRLAALADRLDVDLGRRVKTLSRGNRQKVSIVAALAHDPDLLILDEPTSGLDPLIQERFNDLIREERARGKTVFMSSHVLSEVEVLCDRVGIIRDGEIIAVDTVAKMKQRRVKYVSAQFSGQAPDLTGVPGVRELTADGSRLRFVLAGEVAPLVGRLAGTALTDLTIADPPLEEVFRQFYNGGGGRQ